MKKGILNKLLPHILALAVFLVVALIYCKPALTGKVVNQSDVIQWKGAIQQSVEYKQQHGHYPLWTNSLFSGMPAFYLGYDSYNVIPWFIHGILTLYLPIPIQFFFSGLYLLLFSLHRSKN